MLPISLVAPAAAASLAIGLASSALATPILQATMNEVIYTLPPGAAKKFCRLEVTP